MQLRVYLREYRCHWRWRISCVGILNEIGGDSITDNERLEVIEFLLHYKLTNRSLEYLRDEWPYYYNNPALYMSTGAVDLVREDVVWFDITHS